MFNLFLRPLWTALKATLKPVLADRFSVVGRHFKATLSSTLDDLVAALQEEFFETQTWRHYANGVIRRKGSDRALLSTETFPLDTIRGATVIRDALVKRLRQNVRLDALRTDAGVTDNEWNRILEQYAAEFVRHGLPFALRRMIKNEQPLYLSRYVIDLPQLEPSRVDGKAGHHTLVVLYEKSSFGEKLSISRARKIWKARNSSSYEYKLEDHDGFIAA